MSSPVFRLLLLASLGLAASVPAANVLPSGDARKLAEARVLIVNGLDFETWLPRLTKASGFSGQTVTASKGVKPRAFGSQGEGQGGTDGHDDHDHDRTHPAESRPLVRRPPRCPLDGKRVSFRRPRRHPG